MIFQEWARRIQNLDSIWGNLCALGATEADRYFFDDLFHLLQACKPMSSEKKHTLVVWTDENGLPQVSASLQGYIGERAACEVRVHTSGLTDEQIMAALLWNDSKITICREIADMAARPDRSITIPSWMAPVVADECEGQKSKKRARIYQAWYDHCQPLVFSSQKKLDEVRQWWCETESFYIYKKQIETKDLQAVFDISEWVSEIIDLEHDRYVMFARVHPLQQEWAQLAFMWLHEKFGAKINLCISPNGPTEEWVEMSAVGLDGRATQMDPPRATPDWYGAVVYRPGGKSVYLGATPNGESVSAIRACAHEITETYRSLHGNAPECLTLESLWFAEQSEIVRGHELWGYPPLRGERQLHGFCENGEYWLYGRISDILSFVKGLPMV